MPDVLAVVTATGTEVGKTWLTAEVARALRRRGIEVSCRKPVMSFDPSEELTDALVLADASGEDEQTVCPAHRRYEVAMAPPMAAEVLKEPPFSMAELAAELNLPARGIALVEGVGGPRSPLAGDGDTVSLIELLQPNVVVLVCPAGLGAINSALTATDSLATNEGVPLLIFVNGFDPSDDLHVRNLAWLSNNTAFGLATEPDAVTDILAEMVPNTLAAPTRPLEVQ